MPQPIPASILDRLAVGYQLTILVNYAERHRYGECASIGFVESAVNQVLTKRLVKRQQMQWTKQGAHLLVRARTKVLNQNWEACFRQQYPGFRPLRAEPLPMAA